MSLEKPNLMTSVMYSIYPMHKCCYLKHGYHKTLNVDILP